MKSFVHILILFISLSVFSQDEKRLALVIGNANYDKGELKNPVNDARLIKEKLDSLQFDIIYRENLETNADFKDAVKEFADKRDDYSVAFVYYAGHGIQIDGENFMLPTKEIFEKENDVKFSAVSVQDIMMWLKDKTDEVNVLVLDACRNNPYENSFETVRSYGGKSRGLARMSSAGSLIAFSTEPGKVAADGEGENSYYTISLAKNMMLKDTSLDQVFRNVNAEVMEYSGKIQNPIVASQLTGQEFFLNPTDINNLLDEIQDLISDEKYDEARSRIEPIVAQHPQNTRALQKRAEIFYFVNNHTRSIDEINSIMEINLNNERLYRLRAANFIEINEYQKAEADYTKAIELDPENDENYYDRGNFYKKYLEDYDKAIADFTKAIELDPLDPYNYYQRGYTFGANEQYNEALATYLKAEELDKDKSLAKSGALYNNMAVIFENLNQNDKAIEYYTKEIEIRPDYFLGYRNRALRYAVDLKDYEKAEADYTKAIELDPENDENYYDRGNFYKKYLEDYDKAIADFTKAIELDPLDPYNYYQRGITFGENEQYNEALASYLKAEELDKDKSLAKSEALYNNMAVIFENLNQNDKAIEYYTKEIEISPDYFLGYRNRALRYAVDLKDYEKAEADYTKAIELDPENDENYYYRGNFYEKYLEDYDKAIADFTKAIELDPLDPYNYYQRGYTFGENEQYNEALATYLKAEELDKDKSLAKSGTLYNNMAVIFENLNQNDKAIEYYTKEIEISPDYFLGYRNRALRYAVDLKDYEKAEADYTKAIELDPENDENYYYRGNFYEKYLEDYDKAIADFTKAIELDPLDPYNYYQRGYTFGENEQYNEALASYLKAEELDKDKSLAKSGTLYNNMAVIFENLNQNDKAIEYYTKEIEISPDYFLGYRNRALRYAVDLKDYEKAEADYTKAIELDPENDENYYYRGNFYEKYLEDYDKAIADFTKAIELDPLDPYNYYQRGYTFGENEQYNEALATYLKAEELDKDKSLAKSGTLYNNMAVIFENLNQNDKAIEYYTKEIEIRPDYFLGYRNRALRYAVDLKDYEKAEADYTKAIELDPENDENYYDRGNFYKKYLEDYDKAIADFTKAIELDPLDPYNYYQRGYTFGKNEQYNEALATYLKAEELDKDKSLAKSGTLYNNMAVIFENLNQNDKAIEYYTKEIEIRPDYFLGYRNRALRYALDLKDYEKAEADYTKAIELDPENDENYYQRGNFYKKYLEDYDKAIADFTKAIELDPLDPYNYYQRGYTFGENEQYNEALASYLKAEELDKDKSLAKSEALYNNMAVIFENLNQNDKAIEYYTKEIEIRPNYFLGYRNRALRYAVDLKDYEKAEADYTKAIELDPENDENYYYRGNFYKKYLEDYDKAIADFTKAIELDPLDPYNYYQRGITFGENEQYNEALASYLKAEELDKDKSLAKSEALYNNMAVIFENLNQNDKAIEYYTKEIEIRPDYFLGYRNRALRYAVDLKDYEKAEADYTKAIELDPENDENYYDRGNFYKKYLEDYDKAIADFTKAIELDPLDPYNYYQRGYTFGANEQYNEALATYLKAEELDKDKSLAKSGALYNNMAVIFENLNQNDKAIEYYTKEIEIRPDYFLGYGNRALRYAVDLKDYEKAEADYTKAIELDPENDENYYYRGNFYEKYLEDYDKAIADFTKAIEINPNATNFYNRARFRYVLENYELAISDYLRSLELDLDQKTSKDRYLLNGLAMAYKQLGNLDSAIIYLEKEINISPKNSLAYRNLGDIYVELRQFDKAREIYNNLINVDSKNAQSYAVRAQFFMTDIDDYLSSISDLSKAIELEIDNSDFYFKRAKVYFKIKDYRKALNDFEKSLELNPEITNSEYMYAEIANCYSGIGAFDKALDYYNMEIDLGENADAYSERAMFYDLYLNDFEKANLDFEKAIELAPNTNNIVLQYLNFLYSNKKYEHALEISKKASEIEPKDPQSDYVSALIFMEINKPFQALTHLNSCIQKIIRFSGERYWISDRSNSEVDLSEVFLMRGNFYKNKDKELMCSDYQDALNFTFDENQKAKINSLLLENCGI